MLLPLKYYHTEHTFLHRIRNIATHSSITPLLFHESDYYKPYLSGLPAESITMESTHTYEAQASTNYKEAFALFDKRGNGRVQLDSLGDLLRACGQNPTLAEIRELEKNVGSDCKSSTRRNRGRHG